MLTRRIAFYNNAWYMVLGSIPVSLYYSYKIRVDPANTQRYFLSNTSMGIVVMCVFGYGLIQRSKLETAICTKYFDWASLDDLKRLSEPHAQVPPPGYRPQGQAMPPQLNMPQNYAPQVP